MFQSLAKTIFSRSSMWYKLHNAGLAGVPLLEPQLFPELTDNDLPLPCG